MSIAFGTEPHLIKSYETGASQHRCVSSMVPTLFPSGKYLEKGKLPARIVVRHTARRHDALAKEATARAEKACEAESDGGKSSRRTSALGRGHTDQPSRK